MPSTKLLKIGNKTFWQTRKTLLLWFFVLAAIALVALLFYAFKSTGRQAVKTPVIPSAWLQQYFSTTNVDDVVIGGVNGDPDHDKLSNYQEYTFNTNPLVADTDGDAKSDGQEVAYGTDPKIFNASASAPTTTIQKPLVNIDSAMEEISNQLTAEGLADEGDMDEFLDLNRPVVMPTIADAEIKIVADSAQAKQAYQRATSQILQEFSNGKIDSLFGQAFNADSFPDATTLVSEFSTILSRLKALSVPRSEVANHKNSLIFFGALKKIAEAKIAMLKSPGDISGWSEIMYQAKILSVVGGEDFNFSEADVGDDS